MVNYAKLLDLGKGDLYSWFEKNGYPGLKASPCGGECDYVWILQDGVYEVVSLNEI